MNQTDKTLRFLFENTDVRGEIVTLHSSFQQATAHQNLSAGLTALLGDFLAAVALLSESLKFQGVLTLQARGDGPVPLIMAEAAHSGEIRGIVKTTDNDEYQDKPGLQHALGQGVLTLTVDPEKGERYQGIIPLENDSLAACLTQYFEISEQLPSQLWLFSNTEKCGGLMLQSLPAQKVTDPERRDDIWRTVKNLAATTSDEELFSLEHEALLFRLFHEMDCMTFPAREIVYRCSCTRERSANAIVSLGKEEVAEMLAEQSEISLDCQFCGQHYAFNEEQLTALFAEQDNSLH